MATNTTKSAKDVIKEYLEARAAKDPQFAANYAKEGKNLDECFKYILGEARQRGNQVCMTDDEVFGLAVHYYDEDNIKVRSTGGMAHVATSAKASVAVKLTAKEKEAAKEAAIKEYQRLCLNEEAEKDAKRKKAEAERKKEAARRKAEQRGQQPAAPSLFDFSEL